MQWILPLTGQSWEGRWLGVWVQRLNHVKTHILADLVAFPRDHEGTAAAAASMLRSDSREERKGMAGTTSCTAVPQKEKKKPFSEALTVSRGHPGCKAATISWAHHHLKQNQRSLGRAEGVGHGYLVASCSS